MKHCAYCGRENTDEATCCRECGTDEFKSATLAALPETSPPPVMEFLSVTPAEMQQNLVTLLTCRTLAEADLIVSRLEGAGIAAFIPDQFLMQAVCWNLNAYGYVRVQISPKDYEAAKEYLLTPGQGD